MLREITIPGSKSIANRALILNALSGNRTELKNLPNCDDTNYLNEALQKINNHQNQEKLNLYTGNAGTTTRFLTAFCTTLEHPTTIDGNERMRERPIEELVKALRELGADIDCPSGCPPLTIKPQKASGGKISLKGNISSQYLSAILMTSAFFTEDTEIEITEELFSKPYIEITLKVMTAFGLKAQNNNFQSFSIAGNQQANPPSEFIIESDASNASYFGAYAAMHPQKPIKLNTLNRNSIQGDIQFIDYLEKMNCKITEEGNDIIIQGPKKLKSFGEADFNSIPDLVMTFAVLALFADTPTKMNNIANLRIKETDRIQALVNELAKFGAKIESTDDSITIHPIKTVPREKIEIETYDDHRMAMCFAPLTDIYPNISIFEPNCVSKSYPNFWKDLKKINQN